MKRITIMLLFLFGYLNSKAQTEKNIVYDANAETRQVAGFNAIEISGAIDLFLSQGKEEAVAVSAGTAEITSSIRTEVKNGTLHIYTENKSWKTWGNQKVKAYVTFTGIKKIEASGACNVKLVQPIRSDALRISMSGASDLSGELSVDQLLIDASGASNLKLGGTSKHAEVRASGACNIRAFELLTEDAKLEATGASNIKMTIQHALNANASGGSSIQYKGKAVISNISSSGGASIKNISSK